MKSISKVAAITVCSTALLLGFTCANSATSIGDSDALSEITVTAQKRTELLQDVPVPVTVLAADNLVDNGQFRLQDYFSSVPGLSFTPGFHGEPIITIRGMGNDLYTNPTVAITVDDVPYGSTTGLGGGNSAPDLDPSDLSKIEVLRGPQGTLYGASSLGGLVKYTTISPSLEGVSGRVQAGVNSVYNGENLGYSARGGVNVPVSDTVALYASGFVRRDPGYIDNIVSGVNGVNWAEAYGGRFSGLWQPSQDFSVKLGALYQNFDVKGASDAKSSLGLNQTDSAGTGWNDSRTQTYTANVSLKLGGVNLASITGYTIDNRSDEFDYYNLFPGAALPDTRKTDRLSQEFRFSGSIGPTFDWLAGAMLDDEHSTFNQTLIAIDQNTGAPIGTPFAATTLDISYREYAIFGDLTAHFTDQFNIQFGTRESEIKQSIDQISNGTGGQRTDSTARPFTFLITPQYKISGDLMLYMRVASGYRPGGPNQNVGLSAVIPAAYEPDKTYNYELGVKGDAAEHRITFDASLYYIDWKNIQLTLTNGVYAYYSNGGDAKSEGVELSSEFRPIDSLKIAAWVSYCDAELTQNLPVTSTAYGLAGDRLPLSSRITGNISIDETFPITDRLNGSLGGSLNYVGDREGPLVTSAAAQREVYPGYARFDLHSGLTWGSWTTTAYINNVADKRGVLGAGLTPITVFYIQPRTVGLSLAKKF